MPRYIVQPDDVSCAPTALINIGKWSGKHLSLKKDFQRLYIGTHCGPNGSEVRYIDKTLRKEFSDILNIRKVRSPELKEVETHIKNGGSALIAYSFKDDDAPTGEGCHIALFTDIWEDDWIGHNVVGDEPSSTIPYPMMLEYFYTSPAPISVWLLKRKKNNV